MSDRIKNLLIGIFVATATGIVIFMLLFLHPYIGNEEETLHVLFTDIDKVNVGTRVLFAGKPIGEVVEIKEVVPAVDERAQVHGEVYSYELVLKIDSSIRVFTTDRIVLRTAGLLGERSVAIDPIAPLPGQKLQLVTTKDVMYAAQVGTVEDVFNQVKIVAGKVDEFLDKANNALETLKKKNTWENVADSVENIREVTDRLASSWDNVDDTIKNISKASDDIANGKGTLGQLITKDDLYLSLSALLSKGETTLDDINHYGILFNLDKGWQRLRARRMNLMEKLSSPQEFRNYFNDEVDQIQTSLSRVAMVMEKTSNCADIECMMENDEFKKVFAELMRRVASLEEEVKMYNIQLNEPVVQKTELE